MYTGFELGSRILECRFLATVGDNYLSTFNKHKGRSGDGVRDLVYLSLGILSNYAAILFP